MVIVEFNNVTRVYTGEDHSNTRLRVMIYNNGSVVIEEMPPHGG